QVSGGSRSNTSLLILRIGGKIVVEGSHGYKVHVFDERNPAAPKLFQSHYDCERIRRSISDSATGAEAKRSHNGDWQGWVLERI
ncbi:MAG: hypothetical protein JO012_23075, partial [Hyphomicrobiales bacterium]|nr:hypothetical protein [Hyphomicrobiales bacterium]